MNPALVLLAVVVPLALGVAGLVQYASGVAQRDAAVARARSARGERTRRRWRGEIDDRLRTTALGRRLEDRLLGAGLRWGVVDLLALTVGAGALGWLVGSAAGGAALGTVLAAAAGYAPFGYVRRQRSQRRDRFIAQLPDVARTMSNATGAGLSLRSALTLAATEMSAPASEELTRTAEELRLGQSLDQALRTMDRRMPSREVGVLIATLVVQHRAGGDLVGALREMAATLDVRKDLHREIRTLLSGSVATGYVVALLGIASVAMVMVGNPDALGELLASGLGRIVVGLAVALYAVGFVLISRITRIET